MAARKAKGLGAQIVIVHGETIKEPVAQGTNRAALECPEVDVLAHPGLLTEEEGALAAQRDICLELSARSGHSLTNGLVARLAEITGAALVVDSDAHTPADLLTEELARSVARGAGVDHHALDQVLLANPQALIARLRLGAEVHTH